MSKKAQAVMRQLKQAVMDASSHMKDRLPELPVRINDHLDSVASKVHGLDEVKTTTKARGRNSKTTHWDPKSKRPIKEHGLILDDFGGTERGDNATKIGNLGNADDDGGHLGAHRFFGDTANEGIVPQHSNLNRGAWKKMESEWADWVNEGCRVDYRIDVDPPASKRPDRFQVVYVVSDPDTGDIIDFQKPSFDNVEGQTFDRIHQRKTMPEA